MSIQGFSGAPLRALHGLSEYVKLDREISMNVY